MRSKQKSDGHQPSLAFPKKDLWEKFPQAHRVRCRELVVQLLRIVVLANPQPLNPRELKD